MADPQLPGVPLLEAQIRVALPPDVGSERVPDGVVHEEGEVGRLGEEPVVEAEHGPLVRAGEGDRDPEARHEARLPIGVHARREEVGRVAGHLEPRLEGLEAEPEPHRDVVGGQQR